MRHDLETVLAQLVAKVAGHAVEQRIARGQHHHALAGGRGNLLGPPRRDRRPTTIRWALVGRQRGQRVLVAHENLGVLDQFAGGGRQPVQAVLADADNVDFFTGRHRYSPSSN